MVRATVNKWSISLLKSTDNNIFCVRVMGGLTARTYSAPSSQQSFLKTKQLAGWTTTALKPLAGFLFKMPSEKLCGILRHVRLRSGAGPAWCCWPCTSTEPLQLPCPRSTCPLRTLLLISLSGIRVQKTQMQITLFCKRLNKLLIFLRQMGAVCRPQPLCD